MTSVLGVRRGGLSVAFVVVSAWSANPTWRFRVYSVTRVINKVTIVMTT